MSNSTCPRCDGNYSITLREVARIDNSSWLERLLTRRRVHRVVVAYLLECLLCGTRFVCSESYTKEVGQPAQTDPQAADQPKERTPRPSPPAWKAPPPL